MKRFHVNVSVGDLTEGIRFYSALFGAEPTVRKTDYAKWMLEDPRSILRSRSAAIPSASITWDFRSTPPRELAAMRAQLTRADQALVEQTGAACCYANSDKYWVTDPTGIAWEAFHTLDAIPIYGEDTDIAQKQLPAACRWRLR